MENKTGWQPMKDAPQKEPILLLVRHIIYIPPDFKNYNGNKYSRDLEIVQAQWDTSGNCAGYWYMDGGCAVEEEGEMEILGWQPMLELPEALT